MTETAKRIEHRHIEAGQCPRCGGSNTSSAGRDGTLTETFVCHDCTKVNEDLDCYDVVRSEAIVSVNWTDADGQLRTVYDRDYLARAAAPEMLRSLFALDRTDRGGQIPWVHNAGVTYDIEALRAICLAFCRAWNDEIVPVLQKATGLENPVAKIVLPDQPDLGKADVSSLIRGYQYLAKFNCDQDVLAALQQDHDWTDKGAAAVLKLAKQYGSFVLRNALALAIVLDIVDGSKGL